MAFVKILMKGYKIKPELGNHRQYRKSVVTFSCQYTSINPHNRQGSTDCTVCTTVQIGLNSQLLPWLILPMALQKKSPNSLIHILGVTEA